jgi:hypothetical protein
VKRRGNISRKGQAPRHRVLEIKLYFRKSHQACMPGVKCIWEDSMKSTCYDGEFVLCSVKYRKLSKNYKPWESKIQKVL